MPDTGWRNPGTVVSDAAYGTAPWNIPNNAKTSNNAYAEAAASPFDPAYSHYLKATNFGFAIPDGAIIDGIVVEIERKANLANKVSDERVRIVRWDGVVGGTDKSKAGFWSTGEAYYSYGGVADKWGEPFGWNLINDSDFGVVLATYMLDQIPTGGTAYVDHIRIKVYYTEPSTNTEINIGDVFKDVDEMKINIGDVWKPVAEVWINIGDVWKQVF